MRGYTKLKIIAANAQDVQELLDEAVDSIVSQSEIAAPWRKIRALYPQGYDSDDADSWPECFRKLQENARVYIFLDQDWGSYDAVMQRDIEFAVIKCGQKYYRLLPSFLPDFTDTAQALSKWALGHDPDEPWQGADWTKHSEPIDRETFENFEPDKGCTFES